MAEGKSGRFEMYCHDCTHWCDEHCTCALEWHRYKWLSRLLTTRGLKTVTT
jgi:hypothetical protein